MNKPNGSARALLAAGSLLLMIMLVTTGCETTVIRSEGIGASTTHPTTSEPAGSDPLSKKVWGESSSKR